MNRTNQHYLRTSKDYLTINTNTNNNTNNNTTTTNNNNNNNINLYGAVTWPYRYKGALQVGNCMW